MGGCVERSCFNSPRGPPEVRSDFLCNVLSLYPPSNSGASKPILDLISEYTRMNTTLLLGGPEPADNGRLNVIRCVVLFLNGKTKAYDILL